MTLDSVMNYLRPVIEQSLIDEFNRWLPAEYEGMRDILAYHMGWQGEGGGEHAQGKRIRPLIVLLSCSSAGGNWENALSAASAIEFIHNFSLLHDDIQDRSDRRRGRLTVWIKWGEAIAINAGDALFTTAYLTLTGMSLHASAEMILQATHLMSQACLRLTQGQHLDISYERLDSLPDEAYWAMIEGKTASLLACAAQTGALLAGADSSKCEQYYRFGLLLGKAFQVVDDWLGIWGDPRFTGKPAGSDLVSGKKTMPILYGLKKNGLFAKRWLDGAITPDETYRLSQWLVDEGAQEYTQNMADQLTQEAMKALEDAVIVRNEHYKALKELSIKLTTRRY